MWLTRAGLQQIGLPYKVWGAKAATLNHLYWCNAARLWVEKRDVEKGRQGVWLSERELRYQAEQGEREQRAEQQRIDRRHLPDAEVLYGAAKVAIEVELTPKVPDRALAIMRELVWEYRAIWYFVGRDTQALIPHMQQRLPDVEQGKIRVIHLEQLA